jgi:hypothetical protein
MELDKDADPVHFFLWVSHGLNISHVNTHIPVNLPFKQIVMYSKTFKSINANKLQYMQKASTCDFLTGACPIIPIKDNKTNKKKVLLPTLVFGFQNEDNNTIVGDYSGLYYIPLKKCISRDYLSYKLYGENVGTNLAEYVFESNEDFFARKVFDWQSLFDYYRDRNYISYSQIFHLVKKVCRKELKPYPNDPQPIDELLNSIPLLNIEDIVLGIYSCQSLNTSQDTIDAYTIERGILQNLLAKEKDNSDKELNAIIYSIRNPKPKNTFFSPTVIPLSNGVPLITNWKPILGFKTQGCALNVLSLFRLLTIKEAKEEATCLTNLGTSIYAIIDYINDYLKNQVDSLNYNSQFKLYEDDVLGYIIHRRPKKFGISMLYNFMRNFNINDNDFYRYAIIFKMYRSIRTSKNKIDHSGHTVAFYKENNSQIYFIDPQQDILMPTNEDEYGQIVLIPPNRNVLDVIREYYTKLNLDFDAFKYVDCIYSVKNSFEPNRASLSKILLNPNEEIIDDEDDEDELNKSVGGNKKFKTKKYKNNKSLKHKNKKNKNTKKHKNTKNTKKIRKHTKDKKYKKLIYKGGKNQRRRHHGGELDDYQELIKKIDEKYNTPTVIDLTNNLTVDQNIDDF